MSGRLLIQKRPRAIPVNTRLLRSITKTLLNERLGLGDFDLAIHIVRAPEMSRLNEKFLQHQGSTDVITFDYSDNVLPASCRQTKRDIPVQLSQNRNHLHGEIFICIDDAIKQAREFRTTWPAELARYVIHGVLHLRGFDDLHPSDRRIMKREESRLLKEVTRLFPLRKLAADSKLTA